MAHRTQNPSTLVTVLVSTVSALVGGAVVHQLWRSGKLKPKADITQTYFVGYPAGPVINPRRRRRRR